MKRIEFMGHRRKSAAQSRNSVDAVMMLAQISLERRRLEQERASLEKRLKRIDGRLTMIAGTETRLLPAIQTLPGTQVKAPVAQRFGEMVVQY